MNNTHWQLLQNLRTKFLDGTAGHQDYWQTNEELELYNQTFAQRIGWKWQYVVNELQQQQWQLPLGEILDFGCGSGIAGRTILSHYGTENNVLNLFDRSHRAMEFSFQQARSEFPELHIKLVDSIHNQIFHTVLISHVITELTEYQLETLCKSIESATCVIWVEPGTYIASRALLVAREIMREHFDVVVPCTHQQVCGMNSSTNRRHWCHFFATPPEEAFNDRDWSRFAEETGIDISDLPLSYLVMDKRPQTALTQGSMRFIARADVTKKDAIVVGCSEVGVKEYHVSKQTSPALYKDLKKEKDFGVIKPDINGREITTVQIIDNCSDRE